MSNLFFIPRAEFARVAALPDPSIRLRLIADMCRLNTLVEIKKAGSGHLGSSFSAMDVNIWLYYMEMNIREKGFAHPDRDIFFSSKGHDVPGLYAVLHSLGMITEEKLFKLRRLGGLDGHPDVHIPGMEANSGSLGMGISKARGMSWAKRQQGRKGRVFVMTGDGELQEGQIWESLQTTVQQGVEITVIVDHNKLQTDMPVDEITALGDLPAKFRAFGWHVERCNGHDFAELGAVFTRLNQINGRPKVLIADTIKGRGVSFMEDIAALPSGQGKYLWHSGAPADEPFQRAFDELHVRLATRFKELGLAPLSLAPVVAEAAPKQTVTKQYVAAAYGEELVRLAEAVPGLVVLDGDLAADCKVRGFAERFPARFIENGIAEQDMVSMAGGLARQGLLPVCNSFSSFLCARANEQIYNNACEGTKIIYAAHFAGMIPAGPGKSHQSVRDIGLLGSLPNLVIVQPCNLTEAQVLTRWAVLESRDNVCLRMNIGPSPREILQPGAGAPVVGRGTSLRAGTDAVIFAYGPVMLHEALVAAETAEAAGHSIEVINLPWLNRFEEAWLRTIMVRHARIFTLDDHVLDGGMGERLVAFMAGHGMVKGHHIHRFGLEMLPACGTPSEVLRHHQLDGISLATRISGRLGWAAASAEPAAVAVYDTLEAAQ